MKATATKRVLGPVNRVEGDLEVSLEVNSGCVSQAWVNSPLFRGFEKVLLGKAPADALVYTPRICGICSISQSVAAATALADLQQIQAPPNGQLATNLLLAGENLADHLSHFYLFFMPDFARVAYAGQPWYAAICQRFRAQTGEASKQVLPARAAFLHLTGSLGGKWPHSLSIQPGGTTKSITRSEQVRLQAIIRTFRSFLERHLFADQLENVAMLSTAGQLDTWQEQHSGSDFAQFLKLAKALNLEQLGRASDRFMSFGAYSLSCGEFFRSGMVMLRDGQAIYHALDAAGITEDTSSSWLRSEVSPLHPFHGITEPDIDQPGYSWCKAPRFQSQSFEVGAVARQVVNGHSLVRDLVAHQGANVASRVIARVLELALIVPEMEVWCSRLHADQDFCHYGSNPNAGRGAGMVEAARGSLGHWIQVEDERINNYQIIAPTTWNFSPRDQQGQPGPLEKALEGVAVPGDVDDAIDVQHVIRSFDPCMVCTVH